MAMPFLLRVSPIAAAVAMALSGGAGAATIPVNGTSCTLANAIRAANTDRAVRGCAAGRGADVLRLNARTHTLTAVDSDLSHGANGLPLVTSVITINGDPRGTGRGAVIQRSTATDTPDFRLLAVVRGDLTLSSVTLRNGLAKKEWEYYRYFHRENGGGIAVFGGQLTLDHSTVTRNHAGDGGGIFADTAEGPVMVTLRDSTVVSNSAGGDEGVPRSDGGSGGGILGPVIMTRSVVSKNYGGGIQGDATLLDSIVRDNRGTGIIADSVNLLRSTVSDNVSKYSVGGVKSGRFLIEDSTISGNVSTYAVSAGDVEGSGKIIHSTISGITRLPFATSDQVGLVALGEVELTNTIISNHSPDCEGAPILVGTNLIADGTCGGSAGDPRLGPLLNNGGLVQTHALLPGSKAINTAVGAACSAHDQRGARRPQGARCDIGAFERITRVDGAVRPIVTFFDGALANGTLSGSGPVEEQPFRAQAIRHSILLAGEFNRAGSKLQTCDQLKRTLDRIDKDGATPGGSDYVTGSAAPELVANIESVTTQLDCD
ncbi:hypothetical protein EWI61_03575 [Methylolobus aquaticus]|nr:hypothetical protein EWI61_03575 [Methylolobus aquaticus]